MKKKRHKVRYDAYRDIRRTEAQERRDTKVPVTLACVRPIHKGEKRQHVIQQVINVLRDWRSTPFENEGAAIAGLRSALCLEGHSWRRSDAEAHEAVSTALRLLGAKRPTYDQGQREHTERDGVCVWCAGEIAPGDTAYGRTDRFCSTSCAASMRAHRAEEWDQRSSAINRAAARIIARERLEPLPCLHCGTLFRPLNVDARGRKFCSHECAGAARTVLPSRQCGHCTKNFQPRTSGTRFCSAQCRSTAQRTLHPRICEHPACGALYRPQDKDQRFCSTQCAAHKEAKHPRECVWCQRPFMGKHPTSLFCHVNCKSMEYQFRTGRKVPKTLRPPVFDYVFRMAA
jgi:hypothetical protein